MGVNRSMKEVEEIRPLKLGLIGYNREQTFEGMKYLAKNNAENVERFSKTGHLIKMKDGTKIFALTDEYFIRGHRLDQIILFDDSRWDIVHKQSDFICHIIDYCINGYSCVPDEFVVLKYENIEYGEDE